MPARHACASAHSSIGGALRDDLLLARSGSRRVVPTRPHALAPATSSSRTARILGAVVRRRCAWSLAARAGVTDTQLLSILLGVGQLVATRDRLVACDPAEHERRLVCAAVSMMRRPLGRAMWLVTSCEIVARAPLTVQVAVLLWRRDPRGVDAVLAIDGAVAARRELRNGAPHRRDDRPSGRVARDRASHAVQSRARRVVVSPSVDLSMLRGGRLVPAGSDAFRSPSSTTSCLSSPGRSTPLSPAIVMPSIAALGPVVAAPPRTSVPVAGEFVLIVPSSASIRSRHRVPGTRRRRPRSILLESSSVARIERASAPSRDPSDSRPSPNRLLGGGSDDLVAAVGAVNVQAVRSWSRSFDAFRAESTGSVPDAADPLPPTSRRRSGDWTSSRCRSSSKATRRRDSLVYPDPSFVPFPPS